jgi:formate/nitrite transporter FocA (FNT family)
MELYFASVSNKSIASSVALVKAILCNWMVSLAVFMAGASNDLCGKVVGCWFPISTFVAIGLEHSIANFFIMPCALLLGAKLTLSEVIIKNLIPVVIGNAIAGAFVVAGSYSYQFGLLGKTSRERFRQHLKVYEVRKASDVVNGVKKEELVGTYE